VLFYIVIGFRIKGMAIYYTIESKETNSNEKFEDKSRVCMTIRAKKLKEYKVFEKDDSYVESMSFGTAITFPLAPMCNEITDEINAILAEYRKMEESD